MKDNMIKWRCSKDEIGQSKSIGEMKIALGKSKHRWETNIQIQNRCLVVFAESSFLLVMMAGFTYVNDN